MGWSVRVATFHEVPKSSENQLGLLLDWQSRRNLRVQNPRSEFGRFRELFDPAQDCIRWCAGEPLADHVQNIVARGHVEQQREEEAMLDFRDGIPKRGEAVAADDFVQGWRDVF